MDGVIDLGKSSSQKEKFLWLLAIIFCSLSAMVFVCLRINQYRLGKTIVSIDVEQFEDINLHWFPTVFVCHTGIWNKTYMEQNVEISDEILTKAKKLNYSQKDLIFEFAKYMTYYRIYQVVENYDEKLWTLLTELFKFNFRGINYGSFISDAAFRGKKLLKKCSFSQKIHSCNPFQIDINNPSCYNVPVSIISSYKKFYKTNLIFFIWIFLRTQFHQKRKFRLSSLNRNRSTHSKHIRSIP